MRSNVVMFQAPPRVHTQSYRKTNIKLTYLPQDDRWEWSFDYVTTSHFSGDAKTQHHALAAAKKRIDTLNGG